MTKARHSPISPVQMLVDTCVWLDLAKQSDGGKITEILGELTRQGKIQLIVPKIVINEFERNRDKVQTDMTRSVSSKFREVRKALEEHGGAYKTKEAVSQLDNITHQLPIINQLATRNFDAILGLLRAGKTVSPNGSMNKRVVERALAKRAPFHREKNSVADALLMEMYASASKDAAANEDYYCFVTHNTKDFSSVGDDTKIPHVDFAEFFTPPYSRFFDNLQAALTAYLPDEMDELDFEYDFHEDPRPLDEALPFLDKLSDQIWYNRHKNLEYRIETGEHKLVDKWQPKSSQDETLRSVWARAQAAARAVEEKYGPDELGPWDDFEWGMLNGKMSAIRWMLGEDWESTLDT